MNEEQFHKYMEQKYPKIFNGKYGGFCVGPGWYTIIDLLCFEIQIHLDWKNKDSEIIPQVKATQIKEKFGGLRFYYDGGDDIIHGMVRMAEAIAEVTCEECGTPGKKRNTGWIKTLCDKHHDERQKQYENNS